MRALVLGAETPAGRALAAALAAAGAQHRPRRFHQRRRDGVRRPAARPSHRRRPLAGDRRHQRDGGARHGPPGLEGAGRAGRALLLRRPGRGDDRARWPWPAASPPARWPAAAAAPSSSPLRPPLPPPRACRRGSACSPWTSPPRRTRPGRARRWLASRTRHVARRGRPPCLPSPAGPRACPRPQAPAPALARARPPCLPVSRPPCLPSARLPLNATAPACKLRLPEPPEGDAAHGRSR